MFGKPWNAVKKTSSTPPGSVASGSAALPTPTGSGDFIVANDAPVTFVDDPTLKAWVQILDGKSLPIPDPVASWTKVGNIVLGQIGQHLLAATTDGNINACVQPVGGVAAPYAVEVSGYTINEGSLIGFPMFGACLASGNAGGAKSEAIVSYEGTFGHASETDTLGTTVRSTHAVADNTPINGGGEIKHFRIVNDGTSLYYQLSSDGYLWGNWGSPVLISGLTTPFTHWGFTLTHLGPPVPPQARARIIRAHLRSLTPKNLASGSWAGGVSTFVTTVPHGFVTGSMVAQKGTSVTGGASPNGVMAALTVVDAVTYTVPNLPTFSGMTGGSVLDITQ